jgi:hypothetical protein
MRKYVRQYIDDTFVEFGEQTAIHLILINFDASQYFFNIFQYFPLLFHYFSIFFNIFSIFFNFFQYFSIFYNTSINAINKRENINIFSVAIFKYSTTNDNRSIIFNIYQYFIQMRLSSFVVEQYLK